MASSPERPATAGLAALLQRVTGLRLAAYAMTTCGAVVGYLFSSSASLGILALLSGGVLTGSLVARRSGDLYFPRLLIIDAAGAGVLWWLFGSSPAVDFVLFYVVAASSLLLAGRLAVRITVILLAVAAGQVALHLVDRLPLFHAHGARASEWILEIVQRGLLIVMTAVLFTTIAAVIRGSQLETEASERRFRDLVDASPDGIIVHSSTRVVFANQAAAELLGTALPHDLTGRSLDEFVHPESGHLAADRLARVLRGERSELAEMKMVAVDGATITVEIAAIPLTYQDEACAQIILRDITERVRAQEAVRRSDERYRNFFEGIPTALYRTTPDGRIVDANQALVELLGYPNRAALLDISAYEAFVRPTDRTDSQAVLHRQGWMVGYEEELYRFDGERIWVRDNSRIVRDDTGAIIFYEGTLTDITQQKRAEAALKESEQRFRSAFQYAPVGMALVAPDGAILRLNDMLSGMLGWTDGDMLGRPLARFTHPDDESTIDSLRGRLFAGEVPVLQAEVRLLDARGNTVWTRHSAGIIRDTSGAPIHMVVQFEDISDRKRAEETTARLVGILEATPDFVVIADAEGRIVYANRAAQDFYGLPASARPTSLTVRDVLGLDDVEATLSEIVGADVWNGVLQLRRANGSRVPASTVIVNHRAPDGRIERFSAIARDMTETIRNRERLERLVSSKDDFVASVSHELRTPLTAVVGLAEELRDNWDSFSREEIAEFINLVADQSTEVANLVEDLLVAARADIGKVTINASEIDVAEQVDTVVAALPADRPTPVSTTVLEPARAWADATRVRQILRNLLTNAFRYGGNSVEISVRHLNGSVRITVSDDGPGIPVGDREQIFQPYQRAHNATGQPASVGLGLTISRQLARLMGGDLTYRHEEGRSSFDLALPPTRPETPGPSRVDDTAVA